MSGLLGACEETACAGKRCRNADEEDLSRKLIVNKEKCPQNHQCPSIPVCPANAITQKDIYSLPEIDQERCVLCGNCMNFCPKGAFEKV